MREEELITRICIKYYALVHIMDERMRRQWAARVADDLGWGGVTTVSAATALARNTIMARVMELAGRQSDPRGKVSPRIRSEGGGRKSVTERDPGLQQALELLVNSSTRGHPESPLRWTCKSTRTQAEELGRQQHPVSDPTVAALLKASG